MLRIVSIVRDFARSLFPARTPVTVVSPLKAFQFTVLHPYRKDCLDSGTRLAASEADALKTIYSLSGERIQFFGGGRYRAHPNSVFTRIDRVRRERPSQRKNHRDYRGENGLPGIAGE
jgi:hypothetical protein